MEYGLQDVIMLIGALGIFIFGMKVMSDGLQKLAGKSMRMVLSKMTKNRFFGILTGLLVTCLIQSSSATTVMVVSFVNAGLLSLTESLGVVMGANIGTTLTAWIVATIGFKVSKSIISFFAIAVCFPLLFSAKNKLKSIGEFGVGFGLLFIGLDFLKNAVPNLKENPDMLDFVQNLTGFGFGSIIIFVFVGIILTIIVQSSSATTAITLILVGNGWISFEMAAAMVLGENIGTTVTANMAAAVGNVHAKRIAVFHSLFNMSGVIWMLFLMGGFLQMVAVIVPEIPFVDLNESLVANALFHPDLVAEKMATLSGDALIQYEAQIGDARRYATATFHSLFNITNVALLVWAAPLLANFVIKIITSKGKEDEYTKLEYIGGGMFSTPELGIIQARKETHSMARVVDKMCVSFMALMLEKPKQWNKLFDKIKKREEITDRLEFEISNYLTKCAAGEISPSSSRQVRSLLKIVDDLESAADLIYKMTIILEKMKENKVKLPLEVEEEVRKMSNYLHDLIKMTRKNLASETELDIRNIESLDEEMRQTRDKFREQNFNYVEQGLYNVQEGIMFNDLVIHLKKTAGHLLNVNEAIVEQ